VLVQEWIEAHGAAVRGYLRAMTGRPDLADDLWQEVFQRAWRAREEYFEQGSARAYLIRIADRLLCDYARGQKRRGAIEVQLGDESWREIEPKCSAPPPDRALETSEAVKKLWAALDELSLAQRRVLLLRYYGDLPFTEIAELIQRPLNTVLSDCRRGLGALRKSLSDLSP
jgi:RNA polymerase sigma-70 factor (ECF subfamily)